MPEKRGAQHYLLAAASFVIVVAGLRAARTLLIPLLLAAVFAVILAPILHWLQRKRVPTPAAILVLGVGFALISGSVILMVGQSFNDFSDRLPEYQEKITKQAARGLKWLKSLHVEMPELDRWRREGTPSKSLPPTGAELDDVVPRDTSEAPVASAEEEPIEPFFDPKWILRMVQNMLSGISGLVSNAFVVLITVIFLLLEASQFPAKMRAAVRPSNAAEEHYEVIVGNVRRYVAIKGVTSLLTGVMVTVALFVLGVDYAILWGLIAFLFNFIPNIGSIMAAVPAVGLSLLQSGVAHAIGVLFIYVVINGFVSYVVEPRYMGRGLGLSSLVVFLSLVFWGWVLGPIGMLLSAPLTMTVKIVLQDYDDTRWVAVLLSNEAPKS